MDGHNQMFRAHSNELDVLTCAIKHEKRPVTQV